MSRLHEGLHVQLTAPVLECLFKRSIYTGIDFVRYDSEKLVKITDLNYKDILAIKEKLFTIFASPVKDGLKYFREVIALGAIIPSGIKNLDDLLDGGFHTGNLYELCGLSASGKTQICMTIAINLSKNLGQNVLYIDTKNDICANRMMEILQRDVGTDIDVGNVMNKIKVGHINNIYELFSLLHKLSTDNVNFRFLIIDSLTAICYQFLGDPQCEGFILLNNLANILHKLSVEQHMSVLLTNLVTKWTNDSSHENQFDKEQEEYVESVNTVQRPALGKYWTQIPNTRMNTQRLGTSNELLVTILKSTTLPFGKSTKITITNFGAE